MLSALASAASRSSVYAPVLRYFQPPSHTMNTMVPWSIIWNIAYTATGPAATTGTLDDDYVTTSSVTITVKEIQALIVD